MGSLNGEGLCGDLLPVARMTDCQTDTTENITTSSGGPCSVRFHVKWGGVMRIPVQ